MAKRVIKEEGIPVGISSGAAIAAALRQAALPESKITSKGDEVGSVTVTTATLDFEALG